MTLLEQNHTLASMFRDRHTFEEGGAEVQLRWETSEHFAEALYRTVVTERPSECLEVGLACGVSALAILTGLEQNGQGRLHSIDPFQQSLFHNAAVEAVRREGLSSRHTVLYEMNYLGLPALLRSGLRVDLAYIDGHHGFDYALLDFFYADKMLNMGGIIAFNDCSFPAVHKVLRFIVDHRHYEEIHVGLHATPAWQSRRERILRAVRLSGETERLRQLSPVSEDRYFRKVDNWEADSDTFFDF